jgi:hypothetical protein
VVRPTKRFNPHPQPAPGDDPAPPRVLSKGKHMVVPKPGVPMQPTTRQQAPADFEAQAPRSTPAMKAYSKYNARSMPGVGDGTGGEMPAPSSPLVDQPAAAADQELVAAGATPDATHKQPVNPELVVDLRESDEGFEATYRQRRSANLPEIGREG